MASRRHARQVRQQVIALYRATRLPRAYTLLKMLILPTEAGEWLPKRGRILDVGCGYGYLANYLSLESPGRQVTAFDVAADRIQTARETVGGRRNIEFLAGRSEALPAQTFDGMVIADVLHHVPPAQQAPLLAGLTGTLKLGGILVLRETDQRPSLRYWLFNYLLEWVLYAGQEKLRFRPAAEWVRLLESAGYALTRTSRNPRWFPYVTVTFVCVKRSVDAAGP